MLMSSRYLKEKHEHKKAESDDDDNDSVASEDFEEMLDRMMGGKKKKKEIDYMDEIGDSLKNKKNLKGKILTLVMMLHRN